jgi:peptidoglycan/xylan/chitin deacetylase (PgdA/CDA1 family)
VSEETGRFRVALTFDTEHPDRPHRPGVTAEILDLFAERGVRATFFLQGRWVESDPGLARRVASDGHLVGNHSHYHAQMPLLTDEGLLADVRDAEAAICDATGVDPKPWFRCPFMAGADDPRVIGALASLGYRHIDTDVVLDDWEPWRTGEAIATDALAQVPEVGDGCLVLFHGWPPGTLDALPAIVDGLRAAGASFVGVDELERYAG